MGDVSIDRLITKQRFGHSIMLTDFDEVVGKSGVKELIKKPFKHCCTAEPPNRLTK